MANYVEIIEDEQGYRLEETNGEASMVIGRAASPEEAERMAEATGMKYTPVVSY